jgi:DNA-binding PadR family transcriptional regulator
MTATRCAILGQLALRDWSSYDLARSMRRTLRWFWPRAESAIYAEAKRLETEGLVDSRTEPAVDGSSRTRTVYSINDKGREALTAWLCREPEVYALHIEALLRLHLARLGTQADLQRAINHAENRATELLKDADAVAREFVAGSHIFQDEAHVRGLLFDALVAQAEALQAWAVHARKEVQSWPDLAGDDPARERAVSRMQAFLKRTQSRDSA